jgi:diaminopimelate decarboxylase
MYEAYHHITNLSGRGKTERNYMVTGNICETDTFSESCLLPEIQEGDVLAIHNAGAYGFEMSSSYNARFRPAEVLVNGGEFMLIRRRENLDDLLRNQTLS